MADGSGVDSALLAWRRSVGCGASAMSIADHLSGQAEAEGSYPHDADDFGRCERLLDLVPDFRDRMAEMATLNAYWAALMPEWDSICAMPDGRKTAAIKAIVAPIEKADPAYARFGPNASIRVGRQYAKSGASAPPDARSIPMKEDAGFAAHNSLQADELRQFVERYEQLEAEKKDVAETQKELMAEAKGRGYDTKILRKIVALRRRTADDIAEEESILDLYKSALGMS